MTTINGAADEISDSIKEVMSENFRSNNGNWSRNVANETFNEELDTYLSRLGNRDLVELALDGGLLDNKPESEGTIAQMLAYLVSQELSGLIKLDNIKDEVIEAETCGDCTELLGECTCDEDDDEDEEDEEAYANSFKIMPTGTSGTGSMTFD